MLPVPDGIVGAADRFIRRCEDVALHVPHVDERLLRHARFAETHQIGSSVVVKIKECERVKLDALELRNGIFLDQFPLLISHGEYLSGEEFADAGILKQEHGLAPAMILGHVQMARLAIDLLCELAGPFPDRALGSFSVQADEIDLGLAVLVHVGNADFEKLLSRGGLHRSSEGKGLLGPCVDAQSFPAHGDHFILAVTVEVSHVHGHHAHSEGNPASGFEPVGLCGALEKESLPFLFAFSFGLFELANVHPGHDGPEIIDHVGKLGNQLVLGDRLRDIGDLGFLFCTVEDRQIEAVSGARAGNAPVNGIVGFQKLGEFPGSLRRCDAVRFPLLEKRSHGLVAENLKPLSRKPGLKHVPDPLAQVGLARIRVERQGKNGYLLVCCKSVGKEQERGQNGE